MEIWKDNNLLNKLNEKYYENYFVVLTSFSKTFEYLKNDKENDKDYLTYSYEEAIKFYTLDEAYEAIDKVINDVVNEYNVDESNKFALANSFSIVNTSLIRH